VLPHRSKSLRTFVFEGLKPSGNNLAFIDAVQFHPA
jgi:hypothetical protein